MKQNYHHEAQGIEAPEGLLKISWDTVGDLAAALKEVLADFPSRFTGDDTNAPMILFRANPDRRSGYRIDIDRGQIVIDYGQVTMAFRALAGVMSGALKGGVILPRDENALYRTRGVMIDASRNGVPRVETVKLILRKMALMGLNRLMLYCEDTYEVPGEPFFGYFRGRYSQEELREIDVYASLFDIDVVPCIQTLGHCEQFLQWPRFAELRDTEHVLIADEEKSYEFIGRMIDAASAPFRSKEMHIGMDEAHGIGSGIYRLRHGVKRPFDILSTHLNRVSDLCAERGIKPMIWSDMFFRLGSKTNHYYDPETVIPSEVGENLPEGLRLVYWDYYHHDVSFYRDWMARHVGLGSKPVFACGVWCWNRFWTSFSFSYTAIKAGMDAAQEYGLEEVFTTLWSDDGAECDLISSLPGIQYFAERCFSGDLESAKSHFHATTDGDWDAWTIGSKLDEIIEGVADGECPNPAKWLFWHDPLLGFLEAHIGDLSPGYFEEQAETLRKAASVPGNNARLEFPHLVAKTLAVKCALHRDLRPAYQMRDFAKLDSLLTVEIPKLKQLLERTHRAHFHLWHSLYKPFGWEVLDRRYGGLLARLTTLSERLEKFSQQPHIPIAELEEIPQRLCSEKVFQDFVLTHRRVSTPSVLA